MNDRPIPMTPERNKNRDPAGVDLEKVSPNPGLGANFETRAQPDLVFSTKARIWGDKTPAAIEPTEPSYLRDDLYRKTLAKDGHRCMFCGFISQNNQVHNLNDNHRDVRPENLRTVDPLCHGWHHLGELGDDGGVIAYLPGLSAQDANHLQRTILVALQAEDAVVQEDARKLLNWMASHRDYTKEAWGTSDPAVFASALARTADDDREKRAVVFQGLAVVFNPTEYGPDVATWIQGAYAKLPIGRWPQAYHDVMNAPA